MQILDAENVADALPYGALIDALDAAFKEGATTPERSHHRVQVEDAADGTLLLMPCWQPGERLGVKIATVYPDNARLGLPAVHAGYFLMDANSGEPLAVLDGRELTNRRTAAASALASRYLSRRDSKTLLMVGTGNLAPHLIAAHATARHIDRVMVWGRRVEAAKAIVQKVSPAAFAAEAVTDLEAAVGRADIICCATLSSQPLIRGRWLVPGQHLDLVGAFRADMREADGDAVARAQVYVDTFGGALSEAGDIIQAVAENMIGKTDIVADLTALARGECGGRSSDEAITLFKSVGTALEDLAAAELVMKNCDA
jgi:ornithine cyclodeaminase/alanine dehydrogenase-like protein (mu-crystallin family)